MTDTTFDELIIDNYHVLSRKDVDGKETVSYGDSMDFEAIKCRDGKYPYRCLWGKIRTDRKEMFPTITEITKPIEKAFDNRQGLTIDLTELVYKLDAPGESQDQFIIIKNIAKQAKNIKLVSITLASNTHFEVLSPRLDNGPVPIPPESKLAVRIKGTSRDPGIYTESISFEFNTFGLLRNLKLVCGDDSFTRKYTTEYVPPPELSGKLMLENMHRIRKTKTRRNVGIKSNVNRQTALKKWDIPAVIKELLLDDDWRPKLEETHPYIFEELIDMNYEESLHTCLFVQELELARQFQLKTQFGVTLVKLDKGYGIPCEDVAETRPSVMVSDMILCMNKRKRLQIPGRISEVQANQVVVVMDDEFDKHCLLPFDVQFDYSRTYYKLQHQAIQLLNNGDRPASLFPTELVQEKPLLNVQMETNGNLTISDADGDDRRPLVLLRNDLNISQRQVIRNVLRGEFRSVPYLIRGPPGTGKTTTLTEIIVQLVTHSPKSRILVCTQSNSAANLILSKLVETKRFTHEDMIRIIGTQVYNNDTVPTELKRYCGTFGNPHANPLKALETGLDEIKVDLDLITVTEYQVLILTCGSVGNFIKFGLSQTHFTHLILDEAGQCLETEAVMALCMTTAVNSQIILAGDDKQLGPVVQRDELEDAHFDVSLFERIMQREFYNEDLEASFNPVISNTLNYNYRSVPSILEIYNGLFYNFRLKAMVSGSRF